MIFFFNERKCDPVTDETDGRKLQTRSVSAITMIKSSTPRDLKEEEHVQI